MPLTLNNGELAGKRCAVVGMGLSGASAAKLLRTLGASVVWIDKDEGKVTPQIRDLASEYGIELSTGRHNDEHFKGLSTLVLSPGVPLAKIDRFIPKSPAPEIISEIELAWRYVDEPVIAITGTNGKTTTTTLIGHILESAGRKVFVGGNIGTPLGEYVLAGERADVLVLEVSSFQLQNCVSFKPDAGILLNIAPNHLDFHADMEEYLQAKLNLFQRQTPNDLAIVPENLRQMLSGRDFTRARRVYFKPGGRFRVENLPGAHNESNIEAAFMACERFGVSEAAFIAALTGFRALPHRMEVIGEKRGITFVDDSKGTNLDAMRAALERFDAPIFLLAGGVFKGGDPGELISLMKTKVRAIGLFGQSREVFERAWSCDFPVFWEPTLERATARLYRENQGPGVILLSPATASFDLFTDYKARGMAFKKCFEGLSQ